MSSKLEKLRALFPTTTPRAISAFIVPSADAHQSEYVSSRDERRAFISDFTGSAGTAVVTLSHALLWTDGRYFLQAEAQLSSEWTLMKMGLSTTPSIETWLADNLAAGDVVGVDPFLMSMAGAKKLEKALAKKGIELEAVDSNLVDQVWDDQPTPPCEPVMVHTDRYAGQSAADKLAAVRAKMADKSAGMLVVTALDDLAWLFNIRGADIVFNPVTMAYAVLTATEALLFIDSRKCSDEVLAHLGDAVSLRPYEAIVDEVRRVAMAVVLEGNKVWLDDVTCNYALGRLVAPEHLVAAAGPIALMKSLKNEVEVEGLRQAHVRDAAALVSFFAWLEAQLIATPSGEEAKSPEEPLTEYTVSQKLASFRAAQPDFVSLSFATIAGSGANGAVIHYKPEEATAAPVTTDCLFLLDSGGQYRDGTTDVTRTVHFGTPTDYEKACFTRVLQGHIAVARAVFPGGTPGGTLDVMARAPLWSMGLDYRHGTGHGVGAFLNVHEGPQGMSPRPRAYAGGLHVGMTMTDEPGYYEDGKFGIRIESVLVVQKADTPHTFGGKDYLCFENITYAPIQTKMVDLSLLSADELKWLNDYNATCRAKVAPLLSGAALEYLVRETEPVAL